MQGSSAAAAGRVEGKVAVVVGAGQTPGETIGNGRATSVLLAREGARVVCVDRDVASAQETVDQICADGGDALSRLRGRLAAELVADRMSHVSEQFVTHPAPVWRERANFIVNAELAERGGRFEQLWARQRSGDTFEVCCIPFFLSDVALGDVVQTEPIGGKRYVVARVVQPSGRYVFRVWFGETVHPRDEIVERLEALGALTEWSSLNLLAVDASDGEHAQVIADYLDGAEQRGELIYETGRSV